MKHHDVYSAARSKVRSKKRFFRHFAVFLASMFLLFSINIIDGAWYHFWAIWPFVTWGSVILLQYLLVFGFPLTGALSEEWEQDQLQKEMYKLDNRRKYDEDDYRDLSRSEELELKELDRLKRKWDDDLYV